MSAEAHHCFEGPWVLVSRDQIYQDPVYPRADERQFLGHGVKPDEKPNSLYPPIWDITEAKWIEKTWTSNCALPNSAFTAGYCKHLLDMRYWYFPDGTTFPGYLRCRSHTSGKTLLMSEIYFVWVRRLRQQGSPRGFHVLHGQSYKRTDGWERLKSVKGTIALRWSSSPTEFLKRWNWQQKSICTYLLDDVKNTLWIQIVTCSKYIVILRILRNRIPWECHGHLQITVRGIMADDNKAKIEDPEVGRSKFGFERCIWVVQAHSTTKKGMWSTGPDGV